MQKKNIFQQIIKWVIICLCVVISLALLTVGVLNIAKFAIYSNYYSIKTDLCKNPGLSDGFVCQGICAYEQEEKFLVSGYMMDNSPSRIYVTDAENNSYYVWVTYGSGKAFTGHSGGIAISGDDAYIASGDNLYAIPLPSIIDASNDDSVSISKIIPVNNEASFVYADEDYIYVGEYHDGKSIFTDHPYETPDGTYYAIVSRYSAKEIKNITKRTIQQLPPTRFIPYETMLREYALRLTARLFFLPLTELTIRCIMCMMRRMRLIWEKLLMAQIYIVSMIT